MDPTVIVVFGPAGSGKTTVGRALAERLGWRFLEGDAYHPAENLQRMRAGLALGDAERQPWLEALAREIAAYLAAGRSAVLACSALKRSYRERLAPRRAPAGEVRFVYLHVRRAQLEERVRRRRDHFFPAKLLDSQLADLEEPQPGERTPVLVIDGELPVEEQVERICAGLGLVPVPPAPAPLENRPAR